jgi:hypothetical protein
LGVYFAKKHHCEELAIPLIIRFEIENNWIPAFAGMTNKGF